MASRDISLRSALEAQALFGKHDGFLNKVERICGVSAVLRKDILTITGNEDGVSQAAGVMHELLKVVRSGASLSDADVDYALRGAEHHEQASLEELHEDRIQVSSKKRFVKPKTSGQQRYVQAMRDNDMVFSIGPAGTGKTYLAMAMAVDALLKGSVSRIILTRPAVEAGERLGYLPGDLAEKITPYLRPLYDALHEMMEPSMIQRYLDRGIIQVAPLAYMRGRTLNESFIILDEAQNTTGEQMKMFLTRMGQDSKMVITGDVTQIDLPADKRSGLLRARDVLQGIPGIAFVELSGQDVVRHELVQSIIAAYDKAEDRQEPAS